MGTSVDAHCYACGYDVRLMIGGGIRNFRTFAAWPVQCSACEGIATTNTRARRPRCLQCGSKISFLEEAVGGSLEASEWDRLEEANLVRRGEAKRGGAEQSAGEPERERSSGGPLQAGLQRVAILFGKARPAEREPATPAAVSDGTHRLTKGRYRCPDCGMPQLRFGTVYAAGPIMWD